MVKRSGKMCKAMIKDKYTTRTVETNKRSKSTVTTHHFEIKFAFYDDPNNGYKMMERSLNVHSDSFTESEINDVIEIK